MKETAKPMMRTIQLLVVMTTWAATPWLGKTSFLRSQTVAAIMVGMESRKLNSRAAGGHAGNLAGGDGGHGARGAGKDRRERLAEADPDRLADAHLFNVVGAGHRGAGSRRR